MKRITRHGHSIGHKNNNNHFVSHWKRRRTNQLNSRTVGSTLYDVGAPHTHTHLLHKYVTTFVRSLRRPSPLPPILLLPNVTCIWNCLWLSSVENCRCRRLHLHLWYTRTHYQFMGKWPRKRMWFLCPNPVIAFHDRPQRNRWKGRDGTLERISWTTVNTVWTVCLLSACPCPA